LADRFTSHSTATRGSVGRASLISCSLLSLVTSGSPIVRPVRLPPGCTRLVTPSTRGSREAIMTLGIAEVARCAIIEVLYAPGCIVHTPDGTLHGIAGARQLYAAVGRSLASHRTIAHGLGKRLSRAAGFGKALHDHFPVPRGGVPERDPTVETDPIERSGGRVALCPPRIG